MASPQTPVKVQKAAELLAWSSDREMKGRRVCGTEISIVTALIPSLEGAGWGYLGMGAGEEEVKAEHSDWYARM